MAQQLREGTNLTESQSSVPSTHIQHLMTSSRSRSRRTWCFWSPPAHELTCTYLCTDIIKNNKNSQVQWYTSLVLALRRKRQTALSRNWHGLSSQFQYSLYIPGQSVLHRKKLSQNNNDENWSLKCLYTGIVEIQLGCSRHSWNSASKMRDKSELVTWSQECECR